MLIAEPTRIHSESSDDSGDIDSEDFRKISLSYTMKLLQSCFETWIYSSSCGYDRYNSSFAISASELGKGTHGLIDMQNIIPIHRT